jgi:hypothetical protein
MKNLFDDVKNRFNYLVEYNYHGSYEQWLNESVLLCEKNLRKEETGLPVNIWLDTDATYINGGHWKRIKFQTNTGNNIQPENMLPMTIANEPVITGNCKLSQSKINVIKNWVVKYQDYLEYLADKKIDIKKFKEKLNFDRGLPMVIDEM